MLKTSLRKVGDSIMLEVPSAILDLLRLGAGVKVGIDVHDGRLVIEPEARPRYSLDDLLAQCGEDTPSSVKDQVWIDAKPLGRELL